MTKKMREEIEQLSSDIGKVIEYKESQDKIFIKIELAAKVNPLAKSLKRAIDQKVISAGFEPTVILVEGSTPSSAKSKHIEPSAKFRGTEGIKRIIAVASGKGGVGKSSVAAALARALKREGLRVGVLDADIYGPSQPKLFGLENAKPITTEAHMIEPPISEEGIAVMSIGFFVDPSQALVWRGPMATSALKQLIHQTHWGELDTLVVDLPPGTGDIHLSITDNLKLTGALIVTTPSDLALSDVIRGVDMLKNENIAVPILGIINNMAYFSPEDNPEKRYYIFGTDALLKEVAQQYALNVVAQIPITTMVGAPIDPSYLKDIV